MNNSSSSTAFLQKRRFYTVLPLLICPFLILLFWVLGGGTAAAAATPAHSIGGLNLALPSARLKDDSRLTKMDYYRKADQDSAKRHTRASSDPYYHLPGLSKRKDSLLPFVAPLSGSKEPELRTARSVLSPHIGDSDRNEALVYRKLAALNAALGQRAPATPPSALPVVHTAPASPDVTRLENLVQTLHAHDTAVDPELKELSGMLDKLMAIQHPAAVPPPQDTAPAKTEADQVTVVSKTTATLPADSVVAQVLAPTDSTASDNCDENSFSAPDDPAISSGRANAVPAVVDETVTALNGSTVPFRLLQDIHVRGTLIPSGSVAYGAVQMSGDRVSITIRSIQYQQSVFPVSLVVYGMDGLPGIAAPESVTRDVARQSADESVQSIGLASMDQSLGAQAATAGIQAAKTLLSKKVRLVTVDLPAGFQVLLKDNSQH